MGINSRLFVHLSFQPNFDISEEPAFFVFNQHTHTQLPNMFSVTQQSMTARGNALALRSKRSVTVRVIAPALKSKRSVRVNSADESFGESISGQSNWNAYEGGSDKILTKEEKQAQNAKEEAESAARRKASAVKMAAKRAAAAK